MLNTLCALLLQLLALSLLGTVVISCYLCYLRPLNHIENKYEPVGYLVSIVPNFEFFVHVVDLC